MMDILQLHRMQLLLVLLPKLFFLKKIPIFAHKQTGSLKHVIFLDVNVKFYSVSI